MSEGRCSFARGRAIGGCKGAEHTEEVFMVLGAYATDMSACEAHWDVIDNHAFIVRDPSAPPLNTTSKEDSQ